MAVYLIQLILLRVVALEVEFGLQPEAEFILLLSQRTVRDLTARQIGVALVKAELGLVILLCSRKGL